MKLVLLTAVMILGMSAHAEKTYNIKGDEAQRLVESLVGVSWFTDIDVRTRKLNVMSPIQCTFSKTADEIVAGAHCYVGTNPVGSGGPLGTESLNSLSLLQVIRTYATETLVVGTPGIRVEGIGCIQKTTVTPDNQFVRKFTCQILTN